MRVLQISHNNHIVGGSDAVFFATCKMLKQAGHEVIRFCIAHPDNEPDRWGGFFPTAADTSGAPVRDTLRYFYNGQARRNLRRLLDEVGPVDVAHLHIYHGKQTPAILPVLAGRGIPIVQTLHEYKLACPIYTMLRDGKSCEECVTGSTLRAVWHGCKGGSRLASAVMAAEMATSRLLGDVRLVDRFLCVSAFQERIMARAGIPENKLSTLHNFAENVSSDIADGHDGYLLYFGRIEKLKGLPKLIEAVNQSGKKLIIAGTGNWQSEMWQQIDASPRISAVGFQTGADLRKLIAGSEAVVVPSEWYENCPMSVLEAKAHGRPVVGAEIGGIPELVRDGIDGFLFRAGNTNSLTDAMARLSKADHPELSRQSRLDSALRFSRDRHFDQLIGHYNAVQSASTQAQPVEA